MHKAYFTRFISTILGYVWIFISGCIFSIFALPVAFIPAKNRYDNKYFFFIAYWWTRFMVWVSGIRYTVQGQENLPTYPSNPSIIAANHTSALDIPLVEVLLQGYPHVWISKAAYGKIPVLGFIIGKMGLLVDRGATSSMVTTLRRAHQLVKDQPRHLVLFPEGRRYDDGEIHEFFGGVAILAEKLKRPVVPIVIWGLHKIYKKNSFLIDPTICHVQVSIGKPMVCAEGTSRKEFLLEVESWCKTELERLKNL